MNIFYILIIFIILFFLLYPSILKEKFYVMRQDEHLSIDISDPSIYGNMFYVNIGKKIIFENKADQTLVVYINDNSIKNLPWNYVNVSSNTNITLQGFNNYGEYKMDIKLWDGKYLGSITLFVV